MPKDWFDTYGNPENKKAITERMYAKAGISPEGASEKPTPSAQSEGARIFAVNDFLRGSTLSSIGRNNGREDARGKHDLFLHECLEHPRLQVQIKLYSDGHVEKLFLVDGIPYSHLGKAAHELEAIEAKSGKYPRPFFEVGDDPEARPD